MNQTTYNKENYLTWVKTLRADPSLLQIFRCKAKELRADEKNWEILLDSLYRQRAKNGGLITNCVLDRFRRYLDECRRQIKRFQWYGKLASGKVEVKDDLDIERAKEYPIGDIINLKSTGKSSNREFFCCPLHNEKTGSFVWYKRDNSWHCYGGCSSGGDVIDLYMRLHEVDFVTAVKSLT